MKKWFALSVIAILTVLAVGTVVSAQAPQPQQTPQAYGQGYGRGMMGQGWQSGGMMAGRVDGDEGPMHDGMVAYFAEKIGLSADAVEARLDAGETMWQIAESQNVTAADFATLMQDARTAGLNAAVQAGLMTQEQADWMNQRSQNMPMFQEGFDPEDCPMYGGSAAAPQAGYGMRGGRGGMGGRWNQAPANTVTQ